jgi:hypothetical protein
MKIGVPRASSPETRSLNNKSLRPAAGWTSQHSEPQRQVEHLADYRVDFGSRG